MTTKKIDVRKALQSKYKGYVPGFVFRWLQRLVHEDELNEMMELQHEVDGVAMGHKIMEYLGVTCDIIGKERLPRADERTLFVSNHPLGGVDGIIYAALLGEHYGGQLRIPVNDLLLAVYQFRDIFLPVNKYGKQARNALTLLREALDGPQQVLTFPAGLVSRLNKRGEVHDLTWQPSFVRMAQQSQRQVVPLFFEGENSPRFYRWAQRRRRIGWKFPAELILLPDEMIRAKGRHFRIIVGEPIPYTALPDKQEAAAFATQLRDELYTFPTRYTR